MSVYDAKSIPAEVNSSTKDPEVAAFLKPGRFLRTELPRILTAPPDVLSSRMVGLIEGLAEDWRRLDGRARQIKFVNARLGRKA
jgi:hypothetical protein